MGRSYERNEKQCYFGIRYMYAPQQLVNSDVGGAYHSPLSLPLPLSLSAPPNQPQASQPKPKPSLTHTTISPPPPPPEPHELEKSARCTTRRQRRVGRGVQMFAGRGAASGARRAREGRAVWIAGRRDSSTWACVFECVGVRGWELEGRRGAVGWGRGGGL